MTMTTNAHRRQQGVTILETLVAILVLSVGILGMVAMLINSLKLTTSSNYRTTAAQYAYGLADSIRASLPQLTSYPGASGAGTANCLTTAGCTAAEITTTEVALWQAQLAASLPSGAGTICRDSTPNDGTPSNWQCTGGASTSTDPFVIKVCWDESRIATSQDTQSNTTGIQCVRTNL
jgi:type IV pilus assembly protein PilV